MAKISARGCTEVARVAASNPGTGTRAIFVLRSDDKVLRRTTGDSGSGYTIIGRTSLVDPKRDGKAVLARIAAKRGYTKVES